MTRNAPRRRIRQEPASEQRWRTRALDKQENRKKVAAPATAKKEDAELRKTNAAAAHLELEAEERIRGQLAQETRCGRNLEDKRGRVRARGEMGRDDGETAVCVQQGQAEEEKALGERGNTGHRREQGAVAQLGTRNRASESRIGHRDPKEREDGRGKGIDE
ncbi:hypothetical protein ERJ75_000539500 [Trypanosoma vivax]|nr:hypothetical protein ERJ75_000539500 [Trypanosoma vivax]